MPGDQAGAGTCGMIVAATTCASGQCGASKPSLVYHAGALALTQELGVFEYQGTQHLGEGLMAAVKQPHGGFRNGLGTRCKTKDGLPPLLLQGVRR